MDGLLWIGLGIIGAFFIYPNLHHLLFNNKETEEVLIALLCLLLITGALGIFLLFGGIVYRIIVTLKNTKN